MLKRLVRTLPIFLCTLSGYAFSATPETATPDVPAELLTQRYDWVPAEQLTRLQRSFLGPACRGTYLDPMGPDIAELQDPGSAPIYVEADSTHKEGPQIQLLGDVEISQGFRQLRADSMSYDQTVETAELEGNVEIRQPGLLVRGAGAKVNMAGNEARFDGGEFVLHQSHLRGSAESIEQLSNGVITLEQGRITSCEPYKETWLIKGDKLSINPNTMQGYGRNVWVTIGKIPVLYTPIITFPVGTERQSGLLFPTFRTNDGHPDITVPFYWNIAPNYDATIAPRYAGGHGFMLETEFRHLGDYASNTINLGWLPKDDGGADPDLDRLQESGLSEATLRPFKGEQRWLANYLHHGEADGRWYSDVEFTKVSDIDYFRDLSAASFDVTNNTYLTQRAVLGLRLPNWHFSARAQAYQNLLADLAPAYRQLPKIQAQGRYRWNSWNLTLDHELAHFTNKDDTFITGSRGYMDYALSWSQERPWGFIRPKMGVQALGYQLDDDNLRDGVDADPALATNYASIDSGLVFERDEGRQILQPRFYYLYRRYTDHSDLYNLTDAADGPVRDINFDTTPLTFSYHQLFRDRRFIGRDRLDDANQLTVGVDAQWFDEERLEPVMGASLGQVFYFQDRRVTLGDESQSQTLQESDLAARFFGRINERWTLHNDWLFNPKSSRIMRASTGLEYRDAKKRYASLGYRYVREDPLATTWVPVDQLDTLFTFPIKEQWQIVGRVFYDLDAQRELDAFIGFEYDDCCYRLRILARRWLDSKLADLVNDEDRHYDNGIFFEIDLKGLTSSGERVRQLLEENIPIFRERNEPIP